MLVTLKFLAGSSQQIFRRYHYKTVLLSKKGIFQVHLRINNLQHQNAHQKLHMRHLNGHPE